MDKGKREVISDWLMLLAASVLLASLFLLVAGLVWAALRGWRGARIAVLIGLLVAIAFTIHALGTPPTRGADLFDPTLNAYAPNHPTSGAGEVVGLVGMFIGLAGVLLSFTV